MRILLDPDPNGQQGGGNPAPAAPAPAAATPGPQMVQITLEQLQQFQGGLSQLAQLAEATRKAEAEKLQLVADRQAKDGQWEKAMETLRGQHTTELETERQARIKVETVAKTAWRDRELMDALASVSDKLNPGAAVHLAKLWRDEFRAEAEGETFKVRNATMLSPTDFIKAELAKPEYATFLKPSTTGGAGGGGGNPAPSNPANAAAPKNLAEALILAAAQQKAVADPMGPSGLRGRR